MPLIPVDDDDGVIKTGNGRLTPVREEVYPSHDDSWMRNITTPAQIAEWKKKGPIGAIEAFNRFDKWDMLPYVGGMQDGYDIPIAMKIRAAANGEELSTKDKQDVTNFIRDYSEIQARGYSFGGKMFNGGLAGIPFLVEAGIALGTGGLAAGGTASKMAAKGGARAAVGEAIKLAIGKTLGKEVVEQSAEMAGKSIAKNAAIHTASVLPSVARNTGNRLINNGIAVTDKGEIYARAAKESPAITALKALGETEIELASEMSGGLLFRPLTHGASTVAKSIMPKKLVAALDQLALTKGGKAASTLLKARDKVGFNGFLEEMGEEVVGDVLKTAFDLDPKEGYSFDQFLDAATFNRGSDLMVTAGLVAIQGGLSIGTLKAVNALQKSGMPKEQIDEFIATTSELEKENVAERFNDDGSSVLSDSEVTEEAPPGVEQTNGFTAVDKFQDDPSTPQLEGGVVENVELTPEQRMQNALDEEAQKQQQKMDDVAATGNAVNSKAVDRARSNQLRSEIKNIDQQLSSLSKQYDETTKRLSETTDEKQAEKVQKELDKIESNMNKLVDQRDGLELDRELVGKTVTNAKNEKVQMTRDQANELQKVDKAKRVLQAINQGFKSGVAMTKASLKIAQKEYKKLIKTLPQSERGKVAFDFQKFNSVEQATKNIGEFQAKINRILEKAEMRAYKNEIARQLKSAKPAKIAAKKVSPNAKGFKTNEIGAEAGNAVADIQAVLGKIRSWVKDGVVDDTVEINDQAVSEAMNDALTKDDKVTIEIADAVTGFRNGNIEKTKKLYQILSDLLEGRKTAAMLKMEAEKAVLEEDLNTGIESMQGDKPVSTQQPPITTKEKLKVFMRQLGHSFYSIVGKLDIISMHDKQTTENPVSGQKISRLSAMFDTLKPTSKELAGIYMVRKKFSDIVTKFESLKHLVDERKYLKFMTEKGRKNVDLTFTSSTGESITLKLSKTELYDFYMKFKAAKVDPVIKASLINGNKFTFIEDNPTASTEQAVLNAMSEKEDTDFAEAMLEFYDWYHDRINTEYFRPKFGIDMTKNKHYSPAPKENVDFGSATANAVSTYMPTVTPKSVKERTGSTKAIRMGDAVVDLVSHIGDMERAIAWDTTITRMRNFFGNDDVAKIIEHKFGKTMLESIREDVVRLSNGYGDITKGYQKIINDLRNNYTSATLGFDVSKGVKQMTSYFAWLDVMNPIELTKGTIDFLTNINEATKVLGTSSLLKERGMNINADMANIKHSKSELSNFLTSPTFTNWKYLFIKLGDRAPIYAGGWAYYKKALAATGSHEQAILEFERFFDSVFQSGNMYQLTQWQTGTAVERLFTSYLSGPNQYLRRELDAIRGLATKRIGAMEAAKTLVVYHVIIPTIFQWVANFGKWDNEDQLRAALLGNLNGAFIFGDLLEHFVNCSLVLAGLMDKKDVFDASIPLYDQFNKIKDGILKLKADDIEMGDVLAGLWEVTKTGTELGTGLPVNKAQSVFTGLYELVSPDEEDKVGAGAKFMGWSPYVVKKRREEESESKMSWE